jgi:hypothetical protein
MVQCAALIAPYGVRHISNSSALIGLRLAWYPGGTYFFSVNLLQRHGNGIRSKYMAGWCCRNICIA